MADQYNQHEKKSDEPSVAAAAAPKAEVEAADRGLFDFMGKKEQGGKKCEGEVIAAEVDEKVKVSEEKNEEDTKKHESLLDKFQRSNSSSSSSDEEEIGADGEKKKKKKEKKKDTNVPIEKCDEKPAQEAEEKKGLLDKIKEKLPGGKTPLASQPPTPAPAAECATTPGDEEKEKKGFLDKIKEKIPGHSQGDEEEEKGKEGAYH